MGTYSLSVFSFVAATTATHMVQLDIPSLPPAGTQTLSGSFQGYSMEVASFGDMAGNISYVWHQDS